MVQDTHTIRDTMTIHTTADTMTTHTTADTTPHTITADTTHFQHQHLQYQRRLLLKHPTIDLTIAHTMTQHTGDLDTSMTHSTTHCHTDHHMSHHTLEDLSTTEMLHVG